MSAHVSRDIRDEPVVRRVYLDIMVEAVRKNAPVRMEPPAAMCQESARVNQAGEENAVINVSINTYILLLLYIIIIFIIILLLSVK